eukprot:9239098-Pyramimonas_sp.AAC.1
MRTKKERKGEHGRTRTRRKETPDMRVLARNWDDVPEWSTTDGVVDCGSQADEPMLAVEEKTPYGSFEDSHPRPPTS